MIKVMKKILGLRLRLCIFSLQGKKNGVWGGNTLSFDQSQQISLPLFPDFWKWILFHFYGKGRGT